MAEYHVWTVNQFTFTWNSVERVLRGKVGNGDFKVINKTWEYMDDHFDFAAEHTTEEKLGAIGYFIVLDGDVYGIAYNGMSHTFTYAFHAICQSPK
jgi:hypothetical protein